MTAIAFASFGAVIGIFPSTASMLEARLALDWRDITVFYTAKVLVFAAVCFTVGSFAFATLAFTGSRTVVGIVLSSAFCHFASVLEIFFVLF